MGKWLIRRVIMKNGGTIKCYDCLVMDRARSLLVEGGPYVDTFYSQSQSRIGKWFIRRVIVKNGGKTKCYECLVLDLARSLWVEGWP